MKKVTLLSLLGLFLTTHLFAQLDDHFNLFEPLSAGKGGVVPFYGRDSIKTIRIKVGEYYCEIRQRYIPFSQSIETEKEDNQMDSILTVSKKSLSDSIPTQKKLKSDIIQVQSILDQKRSKFAKASQVRQEARFHEEKYQGFRFDFPDRPQSLKSIVQAVNERYADMMTDDDPLLISPLPTDTLTVLFDGQKAKTGKCALTAYVFFDNGLGLMLEQRGDGTRSMFNALECTNINKAQFDAVRIPLSSLIFYMQNFAEKVTVNCPTSNAN